MSIATISAAEMLEKLKSGRSIEMVDVRTPLEFREIHVEGAKLAPLDRLDPKEIMAGRDASTEPLYVVCASGTRAKEACAKFVAAGFGNVVCVEGGTRALEQAGAPVQRGKKGMSLERQVRLGAGLMALTGSILALTVHPYWAGLSAFVGAGLTFAGITDICGMGILLGRMPWNNVSIDPAQLACSK